MWSIVLWKSPLERKGAGVTKDREGDTHTRAVADRSAGFVKCRGNAAPLAVDTA